MARQAGSILRRYYEVSGQPGVLRDTGETFQELAERRQREEEPAK